MSHRDARHCPGAPRDQNLIRTPKRNHPSKIFTMLCWYTGNGLHEHPSTSKCAFVMCQNIYFESFQNCLLHSHAQGDRFTSHAKFSAGRRLAVMLVLVLVHVRCKPAAKLSLCCHCITSTCNLLLFGQLRRSPTVALILDGRFSTDNITETPAPCVCASAFGYGLC